MLSDKNFQDDVNFLNNYTKTILLTSPDNPAAQILVAPNYQGRVMTSTSSDKTGNSYGWINYELIESGILQKHMNAFGGEDRFWFSPEGGQFSVYFKEGSTFEFKNWQTPPVIDTEPFDIIETGESHVQFSKETVLKNHSGTQLKIHIQRQVSMLTNVKLKEILGINNFTGVKAVGFESLNEIVNIGPNWDLNTGTLGIWILGMFKPSDKTAIIIPTQKNLNSHTGLTANYFGDIPADRLLVKEKAVMLRADGKFRSKIGLTADATTSIAGSYDPEKGVLTIVSFDLKKEGKYLKSTWEHHEDPYSGDAMNAYNDGALADGSQMGPFYELESNSYTNALKFGEKLVHRHSTIHLEGSKEKLHEIAANLFGVSIENIF